MHKSYYLFFLLLLSISMTTQAMYGDEEQQISVPCFNKRMAMECFLRRSMTCTRTKKEKRKKSKRSWSFKKSCMQLCELVLLCGCHCVVQEDVFEE